MSAMLGRVRGDGRFDLLTDAAFAVLSEHGKPMSGEDIVKEIKKRDSWRCPKGMDTDVSKGLGVGVGLEKKKLGENCRFVKLQNGDYSLKQVG